MSLPFMTVCKSKHGTVKLTPVSRLAFAVSSNIAFVSLRETYVPVASALCNKRMWSAHRRFAMAACSFAGWRLRSSRSTGSVKGACRVVYDARAERKTACRRGSNPISDAAQLPATHSCPSFVWPYCYIDIHSEIGFSSMMR